MKYDIECWEDCLYKAEVAFGQGLIAREDIEKYAKHLAKMYKIFVED